MEKLTNEELEVLTKVRNEKGVEIVEVMNKQELSRYRINCVEAIERNEKYIKEGTSKSLINIKLETNAKLKEYITYIDEKLNEKDGLAVIDTFLNEWKKKAFEHYIQQKEEYLKIGDRQKFKSEAIEKGLQGFSINHYITQCLHDEKQEFFKAHNKKISDIFVKYAKHGEYFEEVLENYLIDEVNNKKKNFIERIKEVAGEISDATALRIAQNGAINGTVIGNKGKAHVWTTHAGGYNIQRFHYRVLVKEVKE
ncbi:hypothetical protein CN895_07615 [Bacillus cereus]|uniref:hypothetical protein n=1 Tax=Bacillus cereus TaxID=1396 RepID=UPI000BFB9BD5|nr:hypothetical protein [Bacillus cereus]PGK15208.1 hypothetical protein CN895_07615 [Bacillus cereus]